MPKVVDAIYEQGVLRPLQRVNLKERERVRIAIAHSPEDSLPPAALLMLAERGGSFAFLNQPQEDVYSLGDGSPV